MIDPDYFVPTQGWRWIILFLGLAVLFVIAGYIRHEVVRVVVCVIAAAFIAVGALGYFPA